MRRFFPLVLLTLSACGIGVLGNGKRLTEARELTAFTALDVSSAIELVATPGPARVTVTTDENLQQYIETSVQAERLVVQVKDNINLGFPNRILVEVSSPRLEALTVSGASTARLTATACEHFTLNVSGASTATVTGLESARVTVQADGASTVRALGTSMQLDADSSGASSVLLRELSATNARVTAEGASLLQINATGSASGRASGASTIEVFGRPSSSNIDSSGASTVRRAE